MTFREAFKKDGFKGVWKWASSGDADSWKRLVDWTRGKIDDSKKRVKKASEDRKVINERLKERKAERKELDQQLDSAIARGDTANVEKLTKEIAKNDRRQKDLRLRKRRVLDQKNHHLDRVKFWASKNTVYRKQHKKAVKAAKSGSQPKFEPYMANGYNYQDCNQAVRDACARWVVLDGNYTTSLFRDYVPPGGSTTSHHLFGKAGDCGPSAKTQEREYKLGLGNPKYLELYGPNNTLWIKNGADTYGAEGSGNENLHDSHNHIAISD